MNENQCQTDQTEDSKGIGKSCAGFGQVLEFQQTLNTKESIASKNRNETKAWNDVEHIQRQNRENISDEELTGSKVFAGEDTMIAND